MSTVSRKIIESVKLSPLRAYQIAQLAGVHPSTLSKILLGIVPIKDNDERVLKIARVVGVPVDDCFEKETN